MSETTEAVVTNLRTASGGLLLTTAAGGKIVVPASVGVIDAGTAVDKGALKTSLNLTVSLANASALVIVGSAIIPVVETFSAIAEALEI